MKTRGFTLIEMMITVAISAILLSIGIPSFQSFIINNKISTQASDLVTDLAVARSEAVKRGVKVSMCTSTNGTSCTTSAWAGGRVIFTDMDTAGALDGSDTILRVSGALSSGLTMTADPGAINNYIQYSPTGEIVSSGKFTLCKTGFKGREITISNTGRVSSLAPSATCS